MVKDIETWPAGDLTEVGEGGTTLSGGQKARINLARQVYQQKDIYFLDDPFAQLDRPVAMYIYENVVMGLLRDVTKVIVSHQAQYLRDSRIVLVLKDGEIVNTGAPNEILGISDLPVSTGIDLQTEKPETVGEDFDAAHHTQEEEREEGSVSISVYKKYASAVGSFLSTIIMLSLLFMQGSKRGFKFFADS